MNTPKQLAMEVSDHGKKIGDEMDIFSSEFGVNVYVVEEIDGDIIRLRLKEDDT